MKYEIILEKQSEGGYYAYSNDIPELHTQGDTKEEALEEALDGLVTAFEFYFEEGQAIPLPSETSSDSYVEVPPTVWAKVLILNSMVDKKIKKSELARLIGVKRQNIGQMLDLRHETKLSAMASAANALGYKMEVSFS